MLIWNKNLVALSIILVVSTSALVFADDTKSSGGTSHMLLGGVSHSEELPPLPDQLKTGNVFTESSLLPPQAPARAVTPTLSPTAARSPGPQQHAAIPPVQLVRTQVQQIKPPAPAYKQQTQLSSKTAKTNAMQSQLAVKQLNAYLKQQARQGNVGTAGLQNITNRTQMNMRPSPAVLPGKPMKVSASASTSASTLPSTNLTASGRTALNASAKTNVPLRRFRIPPWLAGTWSRIDSIEISRTQLPGNKMMKPAGKTTTRVTDAFGTYKDSQGIIWQVFDPTKTSGSVDRGANIDYHTLSSYDMQTTTDSQVVVTLRATHVVVNKLTHKIVMSYQDEEINSFNRINATRLRTDSSTKVFNFKGKPTLLTVANSFENRTAGP